MPTGYTAGVEDGTVTTLREYALTCARGMGACIMQRDDPMNEPPKKQEPTDYHVKWLAEAKEKLVQLAAMSNEEIKAAFTAENERAKQSMCGLRKIVSNELPATTRCVQP